MEYTGERILPNYHKESFYEHLHRYAFIMKFVENKVVLDIASGEGYGTFFLSKFSKKIYGIDISEEAVLHSTNKYSRKNLSYLRGNVTDIPIETGSVDVIVCYETIEHHLHHDEMLMEFKRVLKNSGILIISSPDKKYYSDLPNYSNPYHLKELYSNEFRKLISNYFKNYIEFGQRTIKSSNIISKEGQAAFEILNGDMETVNYYSGLKEPLYNILIASNDCLPNVKSSIFEIHELQLYNARIKELNCLLDEKNNLISEILNSESYKLGNKIVSFINRFRKDGRKGYS